MDCRYLNSVYQQLKNFYLTDENVQDEDVKKIVATVAQYGYVPIPFQLAKQLPNTVLFAALEQIWTLQGVMRAGQFIADIPYNPLQRMGYQSAAWCTREQHKIESISLMGLMEAGEPVTGCFRNLLLKIATCAGGVPQHKIAATSFYLLPFFQRDRAFNSAYCPVSSEVDPFLEDPRLLHSLSLNAEEQVKLFILFANLAGHPVFLDLLPQTGRYSKTVLTYPECFRWFYVPDMLSLLFKETDVLVTAMPVNPADSLQKLALRLASEAIKEDIGGEPIHISGEHLEGDIKRAVRKLYQELYTGCLQPEKQDKNSAEGVSPQQLQEMILAQFARLQPQDIPYFKVTPEVEPLFAQVFHYFFTMDFSLQNARNTINDLQLNRHNQQQLARAIRQEVQEYLGQELIEEQQLDDDTHKELIKLLNSKGLWPVTGGCWNSAGHPLFHRMSPRSHEQAQDSYPIADHYSHRGYLVNAYAGDMDIVAPWYFAFLEEAAQGDNYNRHAIFHYIQYCTHLYLRFRPNGFRIDHIDHSADYPVSVNSAGNPISYRAPLEILGMLGSKICQEFDPTFSLFAEYMGWGDNRHANLYHAYHQHGIQLAISTDVVGEYRNSAPVMINEGNQVLANYNQTCSEPYFSLAHVMDNHDRGHPDILPALSEFTEGRALLKWIKCLFLPGGQLAQRPTLYLDGNETHTPNQAFIDTFLHNRTLNRGQNIHFFRNFDSLLRFSLQELTLLYGRAVLLSIATSAPLSDNPSNNTLSAWIIDPALPQLSTPIMVVAHEWIDDKTAAYPDSVPVSIHIPTGLRLKSQIILPEEYHPNSELDYLDNIPEIREIPFAETSEQNCSLQQDGSVVLVVSNLLANESRIFRLQVIDCN